MLNRRQSLQVALGASLAMVLPPTAARGDELPVTGTEVSELAAFDRWVRDFMAEHKIPGGQLAITRGGKLVYDRGFGYADRDEKTPVEPDALFRIASISKPITAVAILRLVQQQKLTLDDRIDDLLKIEPHLEADAAPDDRWKEITVAHCLTHTGGWDRDASYDPMFAYRRVAKALGQKLPVGTAEIIRYMRGQPLDHAPGEKYAYSNFGYCLLGRVIEKLAGIDYETFVRQQVFAPLQITAPRIGGSLASERAPREVCYYTCVEGKETPVVGPHAGDASQGVPLPYGAWNHQALDAHGGWITSAADLVRFASAFDASAQQAPNPLLPPELVQEMLKSQVTIRKDDAQGKNGLGYGYGWLVWNAGDEQVYCHSGALACTATALVKSAGDVNLAVLFNLGQSTPGVFLARSLDAQLHNLAQQVSDWPA